MWNLNPLLLLLPSGPPRLQSLVHAYCKQKDNTKHSLLKPLSNGCYRGRKCDEQLYSGILSVILFMYLIQIKEVIKYLCDFLCVGQTSPLMKKTVSTNVLLEENILSQCTLYLQHHISLFFLFAVMGESCFFTEYIKNDPEHRDDHQIDPEPWWWICLYVFDLSSFHHMAADSASQKDQKHFENQRSTQNEQQMETQNTDSIYFNNCVSWFPVHLFKKL